MNKKDTGKFGVFKGKDNQFYFRLKAPSGEIIGRSEGYTQKYNALNGIEAVKVLSQSDDNFRVYQTQDAQWYFHLKAPNEEIILRSNGYFSKQGALNAIEAVKRSASVFEYPEPNKTKTKNENLYPDILFHFSDKEGLYGVLESKFKLSYAKEKIIAIGASREIGVPMVSFCDLRLSELKKHMNSYGKYGIGLTKDWANRKGLNPVLYLSRYSPFTDGLLNGLKKIPDINVSNIYRYIKNYEAPLKRDGHALVPNHLYADEREWRYVLPLETSGIPPFVSGNKIRTKKMKDELNHSIDIHRLLFKAKDIRYIIVESDKDIPYFIKHLQSCFPEEKLSSLASKILTSEQIAKDI